jgi:hypothetical protein
MLDCHFKVTVATKRFFIHYSHMFLTEGTLARAANKVRFLVTVQISAGGVLFLPERKGNWHYYFFHCSFLLRSVKYGILSFIILL